MMNTIWENLLAIVGGEPVRSFSDLDLDTKVTGIDRRFLAKEAETE